MKLIGCILLVILQLTGCYIANRFKPVDAEIDAENRRQLEEQYQAGIEEANSWPDAIPSTTDCDSLVFSGIACAAGSSTSINSFRYDDGSWHRRPAPACYRDGKDHGSKTTISNDGLTALVLCLSYRKDLATAEQLRDYRNDNDGFMGEPRNRPFEVVYKPHFMGVLYRLIHSLGGHRAPGIFIPLELKYERELDYVPHIQVLAILTDLRNTGEISESNARLLNDYVSLYPTDYLFAAVLGLVSGRDTSELLLSPTETPTYIRGDQPERFRLVHWLLAARITLYGLE